MYKTVHDQKSTSVALTVVCLVLALFLGEGINQEGLAINETKPVNRPVTQFLQGTISQNELIDSLERFGIKCVIRESTANPLMVDKVRSGSSGYYAGILGGDIIKNFSNLDANTFNLCIMRGQKLYQAKLIAPSAEQAGNKYNLNVQKDLLKGATATKGIYTPQLRIGTKKQDVRELLPYDVELLIDISGSMRDVDGTNGLSKFAWCFEQVGTLAKQLASYRKVFTITTFNTGYQTTAWCTPEIVEQIYGIVYPSGMTDLIDPLMDRLNNALEKYKRGGRPVLIVVITDGLPNIPSDPQVIRKALIDFTHKLSNPGQVIITFLQIGDQFGGREFCIDLDDNLVKEGAKYDIVDTKTFTQLKQEGLVNALVDAVTEAQTNNHLSRQERHFKQFVKSMPDPKNSEIEFKGHQIERQEFEQKILGH